MSDQYYVFTFDTLGPTVSLDLRMDYPYFPAPRMFKSHQPFAPEAVGGSCDETIGEMDAYQCACPNCPPDWRRVVYL